MMLALTIALAWAVGLLMVVCLCRVASMGDRAMRTQRAWHDSHERPLVA